MSISAVSCTPLKPKVSFGKDDETVDLSKYKITHEDYFDKKSDLNINTDNIIEMLAKYLNGFQEKKVDSNDIKHPFYIAASAALAGFAAYKGGKGFASLASSKFPNAGVKLENGLKSISKAAIKSSSNLSNSASKFKKYAGSAIGHIENGLRKAYKGIAYSNIPADKVNPERASIAMSKTAGALSAAGALYAVLNRDSNGDGVKDIMQKSQNVYTGFQTKKETANDIIGLFSEIAQIFA